MRGRKQGVESILEVDSPLGELLGVDTLSQLSPRVSTTSNYTPRSLSRQKTIEFTHPQIKAKRPSLPSLAPHPKVPPQKRLHLGDVLLADRRAILEVPDGGGLADELEAVGVQAEGVLAAADVVDADGPALEDEVAPRDLVPVVLAEAGEREEHLVGLLLLVQRLPL